MSQSIVKQKKESNDLKATKQNNQSFKSGEAIKCGFKEALKSSFIYKKKSTK
jgi:hypothetical protein